MRNLILAVVLMGAFLIRTPDGWEFEFDQTKFAVDPGIPDGMGLPPIAHQAQTIFQMPGQLLQSISILPRVVTITAKLNGTCLEELHALRCKLFNALRWNRTTDDPPIPSQLIYRETCGEAALDCFYAGDTFEDIGADEKVQAAGIRLIAYDPMWNGASQIAGLVLSANLTVSHIAGKVNGVWGNMAGGSDVTSVLALAAAPDGTIYAGGDFNNIGGVAANYIARWDGAVWHAMAGVVGPVNAIAIAPDGLPVVSSFAGGVAYRIYKWTGAAWLDLTAAGSTAGNMVALAVAADGTIYAGGNFTQINAVAANYIAKYSGGVWSALGTGMNNAVNAIAIRPDGVVFAGGVFTTAGGVAVNKVAQWNGAAWSDILGGGLNNDVYLLKFAQNGSLFAGGDFTASTSGVSATRMARWNGAAWSPLGSGLNNRPRWAAFSDMGILYVSGAFTTAGGLAIADHIAAWNGSAWSPLDIDLPGNPTVWAVLPVGADLYLGFDSAGTAITAGVNTINTAGDFETFPVFTITGPGTLQWIQNAADGRTIVLNCILNAGEIATIDLANKTITSDWRGSLLPFASMLPLSDFVTWSLLPHPIAPNGDNTVVVMMTGTTPVEANDNNNQLSGWGSITGITYLNTAANGALYVTIVADGGGFYHVNLYSDAARTQLVGHTATYNSNGAKAIVADNASGLGGTVTVDARTAADADIIVYFAVGKIEWTDKFLSADCAVMCEQYLPLIGVTP